MGILKLALGDIYRGGNSKSKNSHMQTLLRLVGFGNNAESGFPTILDMVSAFRYWMQMEIRN